MLILPRWAVHVRLFIMGYAGNPYWRTRLNTVDFLVLTSLDQLFFPIEILNCLFTSYLNEEINCTEPSTSVSVPWTK